VRRGPRGLVLVLGMLWVAASAGASTLPYAARPWGDGVLSIGLQEDPTGVYGMPPPENTQFFVNLSSDLGSRPGFPSFVPYSGLRTSVRAGGNSGFGRRNFIWHPFSTGRPNYYLPGFRARYLPIGRSPGSNGNGVYNDLFPTIPVGNPRSKPFRRRNPTDLSWRILRDLVLLPPPIAYPDYPFSDFPDDGGGVVITICCYDDLPVVELGLESTLPGETGAGLDLSAPSAVVSVVPEPATCALLLAGLCALAARRRRC